MIFYPQGCFFSLDHQCFSHQERVIAFTAAEQRSSQRVNAPSFWVTPQASRSGKESPAATWQGRGTVPGEGATADRPYRDTRGP